MFVKILTSQNTQFLTMNNFRVLRRGLKTRADFTKNRYKITRGNYKYLHENHINVFRDILGEKRMLMDLSDLEKYNVDWFNQVRGCSSIVLKPKTTEEVSKILSFCNNEKLAVCVQGGNTGVVGGCVSVFDEIIISTELMNEILSLDESSGALTCQAGCVLQNLDNFLAEKGLIVPLDLGAKGTCQIGGNVSTNAGGMRLLRFGNMHGNVLGLEVVKANGEIIDCLNTLRKDNTGYHLKHMFIGSEGTLGIITKVSLQCPIRPKCRNVAFLGLQNFDKVLKTFRLLKHRLAEILSAVEVLDSSSIDFLRTSIGQNSPIGEYPFYLMIETYGSNEKHDEEKLNNFFDEVLNKALILNGTVACEETKINAIWSVRENIVSCFKLYPSKVLYYDISLEHNNYYSIVEYVTQETKQFSEKVFGFGHLGDGNLHLHILLKNEMTLEIKEQMDTIVFDKVLELNGSISAEHGIGFLKAKYLDKIKSKNYIQLMRDLKSVMDPNGIINPYKVLV